MEWYYYVAFVLLFLFSIGMIKIKLHFSFVDDFVGCVYLKVLCFKFMLFSNVVYGSKNKKQRHVKKKHVVKSKASVAKKGKSNFFITKKQLIKIVWQPTLSLIKFLNKGLKIRHVSFCAKISSDDACKTAIHYSKFCHMFYSLFKILCSICKVEVDYLNICPNFFKETSTYNVRFYVQISFGRLFIGFVKYFFVIFIKILLEKEKVKRSDEN